MIFTGPAPRLPTRRLPTSARAALIGVLVVVLHWLVLRAVAPSAPYGAAASVTPAPALMLRTIPPPTSAPTGIEKSGARRAKAATGSARRAKPPRAPAASPAPPPEPAQAMAAPTPVPAQPETALAADTASDAVDASTAQTDSAEPVEAADAADAAVAPADGDGSALSAVADGLPTQNGTATATAGGAASADPANAPGADIAVAAPAPEAAAPGPPLAVRLPAPATLRYRMTGTSKGLQYYADAEMVWRTSGTEYDAGMSVSALFLGSRSIASHGRIGPGGLAPERFLDKSRSEQAAHFNPEKGTISFSANTPDARWHPGVQDRASIFIQLAALLAGADTAGAPDAAATQAKSAGTALLTEGSSFSVDTAGPRAVDVWTFRIEGQELLHLPVGDLLTVKLTRKPRAEYDQTLEIWFAPALDYLPVRNRITKPDGDAIDQQLKSITRP